MTVYGNDNRDLPPTRRSQWRHFQSECEYIKVYLLANLEIASSSSLRENRNSSFGYGGGGGNRALR